MLILLVTLIICWCWRWWWRRQYKATDGRAGESNYLENRNKWCCTTVHLLELDPVPLIQKYNKQKTARNTSKRKSQMITKKWCCTTVHLLELDPAPLIRKYNQKNKQGKGSIEKKSFLSGIAQIMGGGSTHARIFWPSFKKCFFGQ